MSSIIQGCASCPHSPLTIAGAMYFAELQATACRRSISRNRRPRAIISGLPRIEVQRMTPSPVSGATQWSRGRWLFLINGSEPGHASATRWRTSSSTSWTTPSSTFCIQTVPGYRPS